MKMQILFKFEDDYLKADYEEKDGNYEVTNVRNDETGKVYLDNVTIKPTLVNNEASWVDNNNKSNDLIVAIGQAIEDNS
ncbi:hypothetical protein [Pinibacter aurantiacus]|uniref:Uncharacterized protein n=1 Tax=Pinibacter aurantiacus TaxID=2851599 RepID=A0A9E2S720_9BACT|nr:hypothetical protein [Pinibacter aurantiacus]MBV4355629.1 hypothetical protein [Pinibacter aurantiacus]